ncbi:MAG: helicase-exonuclease AddAB subunit AddB [Lachnospiraceae bacterium]|nr:helicase-exonuclease AddAB subunit AddB [Lachnospiraceae bacterium]
MALQFIMGNSGSGKTHTIHKKILKEAAQNPKKNYLVIVPEQFTMQTQRELVTMHENHSIMNIDILSFQRLAYRIFDEVGSFSYQVLEETGKNLILRRVAEEKADDLTLLQKNMTKMGYIGEVKSLISEMAQYNITPERLEEVLKELPEGSFAAKISDVLKMYQGFREFLEGKFVTAEEILELLYDVAEESEILRDCILIFDGFTGFTPIQNHLFKKLLGLAEMVYVTVTIDSRENPYHYRGSHELFAMSKKMITSLLKIAEESHIEVLDPIQTEHGKHSRFANAKSLFFLEQNLFRHRGQRFVLSEENREIQINSLKNPREEMDFVARKIEKLVRKEAYYYRDIAIVCGDLSGYANYAKEVFAKYDIPLFIDQKTTILYHPFIEFLDAVLETLRLDFSVDSIFRYLRTGLSGISQEETDVIENYCLAAGIRGYKKWAERFCYMPKGYSEEELEEINEIREKVVGQFLDFQTALQQKNLTVTELTKAFYTFICERKAQQQLMEKKEAYEAMGDLKNAGEYAQIYRIVMDLFDKMVELLGDEVISLDEYSKILNAGYEAAKVGILPPGYDRVIFGDIERSRLKDIKVLFFVGVNDGVIPKSNGTDGILSQAERQQLEQMQIELAPTVREKTFMQRFYLYLNLTKPSNRLYLSYARVNGEGKALRSSYLIHTIVKMYENLSIHEIEEESFEQQIVTAKNSLSLFIEGLEDALVWEREGKEKEQILWAALCRWYESHLEWARKIHQLSDAARLEHKDTPIAASVTKMLYGTVLENSVTRLEQFAACAFSHFLSYGLHLQERNTNSFAAADVGNIFHEVLELYAIEMKKEKLSWFEITEEESEGILAKAMEQAIGANHNLALYENARNSYARERMYRILKRTVWALVCQVRKGRFTPESFEVSFSYAEDMKAVNFQLSEEEKMHLRGRIDRIDTFQNDDKLYVKIIDYKSGNTTFQFLNVYYGLQLQLVVYMNAALEMMEKRYPDKEVVPAGIFYYHVKDPMIEAEGELPEEEVKQQILKELKLNGMLNETREVIEGMDTSLEGAVSVNSDVIPVGVNKDGSIKKSSKAMHTGDFLALSSYVNETILHLGQRMMQGEISVAPYALADKTGCDYCSYRAVCQFDSKIAGYEYRKLEEISDEKILEAMRGEADK